MSFASAAASSHGTCSTLPTSCTEWLGVGRDPAERGAVGVHAVVGVRPADDHLLVWPPHGTPVRAAELGGGVDRVRAAARREEHLRARDRRECRDALRQRLGGRVRENLERLERGELVHLRRDRVAELDAAVSRRCSTTGWRAHPGTRGPPRRRPCSPRRARCGLHGQRSAAMFANGFHSAWSLAALSAVGIAGGSSPVVLAPQSTDALAAAGAAHCQPLRARCLQIRQPRAPDATA